MSSSDERQDKNRLMFGSMWEQKAAVVKVGSKTTVAILTTAENPLFPDDIITITREKSNKKPPQTTEHSERSFKIPPPSS